jgi:anti-sigma factor RsiW
MKRNTKTQWHPHGEQLSSYGDGMLDVATTHRVAEHLSVCASCQTLISQFAQTELLLRELPAPSVPGPEFWNAAYRRLRVEDQERATTRQMPWDVLRQSGHLTHRRWAAGIAAAAVVAAVVVGGPIVTGSRPAAQTFPNSHLVITQAQDDTPDVSALVESHTDSVSRQPLSDPDRQKMIAADVRLVPDPPQGAANADGTF